MVLLEVENLTKRFGGLIAVNDLTFHLDNNEILGLIGPNGAGKTTVYNLITGYYKPDAGKIRLDGEDITGLSPHKIVRKGIARTFQIVRVFNEMSVMDHVAAAAIAAFGINAKKEVIEKICLRELEFTKMIDKKDILARNLTLVDKKRLELAMALCTNPKVLLLDELLAGLTPAEIDESLELIENIRRRGISIIIVEHIMRAIMSISDRVIVLHFGKKIAEGIPEEVADNKKVIEVYMGRKPQC